MKRNVYFSFVCEYLFIIGVINVSVINAIILNLKINYCLIFGKFKIYQMNCIQFNEC